MNKNLLALAGLAVAMSAAAVRAENAVTGDYVESRSANVYVGACHHEGEVVSGGRSAVLAWNMRSGEFGGVDLTGVRALAVVASDRFLGTEGAKLKSVLYIDAAATPAQREAAVAMLRQKASAALGTILEVKTAPVSFDSAGSRFKVAVPGVASMHVQKKTAELCCKQPYEVWGQPLVPVKARQTGYSVSTEFSSPGLLQTWKATDMNNAFYGEFAL